MTRKPKTIDEYLATMRGDRRAALDKLRKTIRDVAPKVEECIKSSLHFNPRHPLPRTLVRKLIRARLAEMAE